MPAAIKPENEAARLQSLKQLNVLDSKPEVEAHGGYISVESDPEVRSGSTFRIFWPVA